MNGTPDRRGPWRRSIVVALVALAAVLGALGGVAWYYSNLILRLDPPPTLREQRVLAAEPGRIGLSRDRQSLQAGWWALEWPHGYGMLGRVLSADSGSVIREFRAVVGAPPVGDWASVRGVSRSADPQSMLGLSYRTVVIDGPLGSYPAWWVPGRDSTWVLYVHGRGANRAEGLRTLGVLAARGLPGLLVSYRNDVEAPPSGDGFSHLGLTEWEDLEAAVRWALAHGARDVVLSGYSMGGQIVMQFMARSSLARHAIAIVLESPLLDWDATLACRARVLGVPPFATALGKRTAAARARLDWPQLDRVSHLEAVAVPTLIFHGLHDTFVPESVSESFRRARPGRTTLIRIPRGDHVEAWNTDPAYYAATLNRWLAAHAIGGTPSGVASPTDPGHAFGSQP
jgi:hypothetical protein